MKKTVKIIWSPLAVARVNEIAEYIAADNPAAARKWVDSLFESIERLRLFPLSGRVLPELARQEIRELLYGQYRIIYRVEQKTITLLTVRHGKQILPGEDFDAEAE